MAKILTLEEASKYEGGILAGTGHRPDKLGGYKTPNPLYNKVVKKTFEVLDALKPETVISGMALGFDTILFKCALERGIPIIAAVPFDGFSSKWPEATQKEYEALLKRAKEVKYICDPGYATWKMQKRNEWMVDESQLLFGMWDGSEGGTGNCIAYAKKYDDSQEILIINPKEIK